MLGERGGNPGKMSIIKLCLLEVMWLQEDFSDQLKSQMEFMGLPETNHFCCYSNLFHETELNFVDGGVGGQGERERLRDLGSSCCLGEEKPR